MALYAFDGTWQKDEIDDERDTNVSRFFAAYAEPNVTSLYTKGVGTKWGFIGKAFGGAFGIGGWSRVNDARKHLEQHWRSEPIVIVGFSRGAALALDFANEISQGIATPTGRKVPPIAFLGLWDLVASFGVPGNKINLGYQLVADNNIATCYHALSLDERRYTFGLTRVKYADDKTQPNGQKRAYEVWFRGGHSDVGGGNLNHARSNIALRWMMRRAIQHGVKLDATRVPVMLPAGTDPPIKISAAWIPKPRAVDANERVHHTVVIKDGLNNPPSPFTSEPD